MRQFVRRVMYDSTQFQRETENTTHHVFTLTFWVTGGAGAISRAAMNTTRSEHNGEDNDRNIKIIISGIICQSNREHFRTMQI